MNRVPWSDVLLTGAWWKSAAVHWIRPILWWNKWISSACAVTNSTTNKHQTAKISLRCINDAAELLTATTVSKGKCSFMLRQQISFFLCVCSVCSCAIVHVRIYSWITVHFQVNQKDRCAAGLGLLRRCMTNSVFTLPYHKQRECIESFQGIACRWRDKMREEKYHTWLSSYSLWCFSSSQFLTVFLLLDKSISHSFSACLKLPLLPYFFHHLFFTTPHFFPLVSFILYLVQLNTSTSVMAVITCRNEEQSPSLSLSERGEIKCLKWKSHNSSYS